MYGAYLCLPVRHICTCRCQSYCNTAYLAVHGCLPCMYVFASFVCIVACLALDHCLLCNEWSPVCYVWLPALLWTGCLPCYRSLPGLLWTVAPHILDDCFLAMDVTCLAIPALSCLASLLWIISVTDTGKGVGMRPN